MLPPSGGALADWELGGPGGAAWAARAVGTALVGPGEAPPTADPAPASMPVVSPAAPVGELYTRPVTAATKAATASAGSAPEPLLYSEDWPRHNVTHVTVARAAIGAMIGYKRLRRSQAAQPSPQWPLTPSDTGDGTRDGRRATPSARRGSRTNTQFPRALITANYPAFTLKQITNAGSPFRNRVYELGNGTLVV